MRFRHQGETAETSSLSEEYIETHRVDTRPRLIGIKRPPVPDLQSGAAFLYFYSVLPPPGGRHLSVRVNNFWEKSSAGIDGLKLGAGFEQDCCSGELAAGQAGMLVLEDAPIVMTAEGFRNLLFGVFVV